MMSRRAARRQQARLTKERDARVAAVVADTEIVVSPVRADEVKVGDLILRYGTNPRSWQYAKRIVGVVTAAPASSPNDLRITFADGGIVYYNAPSELLRVVRA